MEESAPKRRRTSPRTSTGVGRDATPQSAGPSRPRKHPSFASPTKSSLARHNPGVLERRLSGSPSKGPESRVSPRRPQRAGSDESLVGALTARRDPPAQDVAASEPAAEESAEARREDEPSSEGRSVRRARGSLAAAPRRSPAKPSPRPLPPPGPEGEDELNPFLGTTLRRSGAGMPLPAAPEPELPRPVDDPVSSTPPRGIHSSPSRWRDKSKPKNSSPLKSSSLTGSPMKSSPLKPRSAARASALARDARERRPAREPSDRALDATSSNARKVPAFDPNAAKKREVDALREELALLRKDLSIAERENQRVRLMQDSGRFVSPPNGDEVLGILWRYLVPLDGNALPPQSQQLVKSALNPMGLLPFSKPLHDTTPVSGGPENVANIKSHHPIPMTAEEERPYLQLFTPFEATADIATLPGQPGQPLRQRHSITLRSRTSPGLFNAKLNLIVDAANLSILEMDVPALEPAAKPELGPFVSRICTGDCNRSMQRNIGIVSWAMGEWLRVAAQRAQFWAQLDRELSKENLLANAGKWRERRARRRQRRGDDEGSEDEENTQDDGKSSGNMTELLHFMGRQTHEVNIPPASGHASHSSLRLEWRIDFDWTGEAQSKVAVQVGIPTKWHGVDERGALAELPKLFEDLVKGGEEPAAAVRTLVALLAGDHE